MFLINYLANVLCVFSCWSFFLTDYLPWKALFCLNLILKFTVSSMKRWLSAQRKAENGAVEVSFWECRTTKRSRFHFYFRYLFTLSSREEMAGEARCHYHVLSFLCSSAVKKPLQFEDWKNFLSGETISQLALRPQPPGTLVLPPFLFSVDSELFNVTDVHCFRTSVPTNRVDIMAMSYWLAVTRCSYCWACGVIESTASSVVASYTKLSIADLGFSCEASPLCLIVKQLLREK